MNVKLKKRTMTAVAIACLTAFAANAQAAPRAVTIPKNAKSTVATAAAKIIKNNLKRASLPKQMIKPFLQKALQSPIQRLKNYCAPAGKKTGSKSKYGRAAERL